MMLWNSPDETSQAFFIKWFAAHGSFAYPEPLNFVTNNLIHPRSTVVVDGFIVPGGFIGLPLFYGSLVKVFGDAVLWAATPILTLLALLAFFRLMRVVWGKSIAWFATIVFAAHPAVIYYTARGLFPNMVFVDFLILGAMFLITRPLRTSDLLGAACVGAALLVRFSEIVWMVPLWITLAVVARKTLSWQRIAIWFGVLAIFFSIMGVVNNSLYGRPWSFGYTVHDVREGSSWILEDQIDQGSLKWAKGPIAAIFPFGFHPFRAIRIAGTYAYHLFPLWALLAVAGLMMWFRGPRRREEKIYGWVTLAVGAVLMVYYGSWLFSDHPNPRAVTIGTSYMRYWLPVFALLAPFVGKTILSFSAVVGRGFIPRRAVRGRGQAPTLLVLCVLIILGLQIAVWSPEEGLIAVQENLRQHATIREQVFAIVPDYGIIITDRQDKFFFPARRVVVGLHDPKTISGLSLFLRHGPVYYYGVTMGPDALAKINQELVQIGFFLKAKHYFGSETLYAVSKL